jgi:hypothetical protein
MCSLIFTSYEIGWDISTRGAMISTHKVHIKKLKEIYRLGDLGLHVLTCYECVDLCVCSHSLYPSLTKRRRVK